MASAAQRTGPLYVGLQQPSPDPERGRERLKAARARNGFLRSLGMLAVVFGCLAVTATISVAKMESGYQFDALQRQLTAAEVQHQQYDLQLQREESLQVVAADAQRMGMHLAPNYRALPIVVVHNAPRLRGRSVTVVLPPPPKPAGGNSLLGQIRSWLRAHG